MRKIFVFLALITSLSVASENKNKTSSIPKEQFCHFAYSIYKSCYERGLMPGTSCGLLSQGIKFGKAFLNNQKEYVKNTCKTGCYIGKNKFKLKNENQFVVDCLKNQ